MKTAKDTSTSVALYINWSNRGNVARRKQRFGGSISKWEVTKVGDMYVLGKHVAKKDIVEVLEKVLAASDGAVLLLPHGTTSSGASAMHVHYFNNATPS